MKIIEQKLRENDRIVIKQFHAIKDDVTISLIKFSQEFYDGKWEIYQIKGNPSLFEDVERFVTYDEAIKRVEELLK